MPKNPQNIDFQNFFNYLTLPHSIYSNSYPFQQFRCLLSRVLVSLETKNYEQNRSNLRTPKGGRREEISHDFTKYTQSSPRSATLTSPHTSIFTFPIHNRIILTITRTRIIASGVYTHLEHARRDNAVERRTIYQFYDTLTESESN